MEEKMKRKTLLAIMALAFGLSVFSFVSHQVRSGMERAAYYQEQEERRAKDGMIFSGPYCYPDPHPKRLLLLAFLTGVTALAIAYGKGNILPATLLIVITYMHGRWYRDTQETLAMAELYVPRNYDSFFLNASILDLAAIGLTAVAAIAFTAKVVGNILNRDRDVKKEYI